MINPWDQARGLIFLFELTKQLNFLVKIVGF